MVRAFLGGRSSQLRTTSTINMSRSIISLQAPISDFVKFTYETLLYLTGKAGSEAKLFTLPLWLAESMFGEAVL